MKVILSVPDEGYSECTWWRLFWAYMMKVIVSVPDEGYSERTWWRLFQKRVVRIKFDICIVFFTVAMHINETFITIVHQIRNFVFNFRSGRGHCGRDRMVAGFTTTYEISVYHHWCCEFEPRSGRGVQHYVIMFVSDLRQVGGFLRVLRQWNWPPRYNWNIVESGVKHHQTNIKHQK